MTHDRPLPPDELSSFMEFGSKDDQLLIGADANAHHSVRKSSDINDRGESLLDFILSTNLYIANVEEEHTFVGPTSSNELAITLVKGQSTLVSDWRVLKTPPFQPIGIHIDLTSTPKVTVYRNPRNTNWEKFTRTVTSKLATSPGVVKSVEDIETSLETLSKELLDAYHASCPTSRTRKWTKPPWWNRDLTLKRNYLREFFKIVKMPDNEIINGEYKILLRD